MHDIIAVKVLHSCAFIFLNLYLQSLRVDFEDREARLRTQEKEMKQRDTEINRLLEELRKSQVLGRMGDTYNSRDPHSS